MADEQHELRRINWGEAFPFTHLFKSFRMAIHPSKLALALTALFLILVGSWVLDLIWGPVFRQYANGGETMLFMSTTPKDFDRQMDQWKEARPRVAADFRVAANDGKIAYISALRELKASSDFVQRVSSSDKFKQTERRTASDFEDKNWRKTLSSAWDDLEAQLDQAQQAVTGAEDSTRQYIDSTLKDEARDKAREQLEQDSALAKQALAQVRMSFAARETMIAGKGVGETFLEWELRCVENALAAAWRGNITSGIQYYGDVVRRRGIAPPAQPQVATPNLPPFDKDAPAGFLFWLLMAVQGVVWLLAEHWLYAVIFLLVSLAIWSILGGAIYRIAALQAAREEKISIVQALRFSLGKFFAFFTAPLIPIGVIWLLGLLLMIGGLIGNIPGFGPVVVGVLFFVSVLLGLVIAFVFVGLVSGWNLMYPTIGVEGSDSFDAISRSFAYVLTKPWHAGFYGVVALVYGAICYLFVRVFALLALYASHFFTGLWLGGGQALGAQSKLDVMWTAPTFDSLHGPFNWLAMGWGEKIGAAFVWVYTGVVALLVVAFLLTFIASSATVIYYLLRQRVDATDLDDVYVEEIAPAPSIGTPAEAPPEPASPPEQPSPPQNPPQA